MTPRGGTGMNTAIRGAYDLGWKLAWVLRDLAEPALLDTYQTEHQPLAAHNMERSADPMAEHAASSRNCTPISLAASRTYGCHPAPAGSPPSTSLVPG